MFPFVVALVIYMYVSCVHIHRGALGEGIRSSGVGVTGTVSCLMWVLGIELGSSAGAATAFTIELSLQPHG